MVRQSAPIIHQLIAVRATDKAIQQTVPVNVAGLFAVKKETDAAKAMHASLPTGPPANLNFDFAYRSETGRVKQAGRTEQHGVENLRRAGDATEPFQPANDKVKNQVPLPSTGARSATDGPFTTFPSASNRDP